MNKVVLLCRPGFEKECAAEITDKAGQREIFGFARVKENAGYVIYECYQPDDGDKLIRELPFSSLIFARQWFVVGELLQHLPPEDRITPIVGMLQGVVEKGGELRVEVADTNESKELLKFCRKFTVPLRAALRDAGVLANYETPKRPVVHVFFIAPGCCYTGYSYSNNNSPFYMGIPRLKFPADAPSRSTLKLEEAFHVFIPADEWDERLANGMWAVDLGACPGGWTYQLVKRNMWVYSVDNGPMAQPDPPHSHPAEQISYVAIGECDVYIGDRPVQHLKTGDIFAVPSNVPHTVKSTTKQLRLVDSFTPIRADFIRK